MDPAWFAPDGVSPSGFDMWTLWDDLNAVTDGKHPIPQLTSPEPVMPRPSPDCHSPVTASTGHAHTIVYEGNTVSP